MPMNDELIEMQNMIQKIKNSASPMLYLGRESLIMLQTFLYGFECAKNEISGKRIGFTRRFNAYVKQYYKDDSNQGWSSIILRHVRNEKEAFETFYMLFEGYLQLNCVKEIE